ncbi:hypothetical protein C7441_11091 [Pseudaminobacter salicylatoxidans]|uniref:Uncharacterized protein n=1 Tax=Pseudaminobacter salicylatoxidans TaxID=93369 RepID=A0A316C0X5_PSESE|nr:hypothetical protein [Pseudaminobacter salicylatoxidans]PWJ81559.1 hypothetical protein C7441_11091 [Pseudaminobacter salicylatoxidans]
MTGINKNGGWLKDPRKARKGEVIGGGFFVFRRGDGTNRIRPSQWPYEYGSQEAAEEQARILAKSNPGYRFDVLYVVSGFIEVEADAEAQKAA